MSKTMLPWGPVVEDAGAAADDRLALARDVVGKAEPGRHAEGVVALQAFVDALAGLEGAVEPVRARHQAADEPIADRVPHRWGTRPS
jgi:hypothetical protein